VRITNLGLTDEGDAAGGIPGGAQVSLSFAKFAPEAGTSIPAASATSGAH